MDDRLNNIAEELSALQLLQTIDVCLGACVSPAEFQRMRALLGDPPIVVTVYSADTWRRDPEVIVKAEATIHGVHFYVMSNRPATAEEVARLDGAGSHEHRTNYKSARIA